jgi:hypothetical protein
MHRKKVFLLVASLILMSLFPNVVSAAEGGGGIGEGLGSAFETIRDLFSFLPELVTLDALINRDDAALFWARFLIWLLLFAVVYFGAGFVFKDNKNITIAVALVISLMGALMVPTTIVVNIFQSYGLIAGLLIWIIPVAAGFWLTHTVKNRWLKVLIYIFMLIILLHIDTTITSSELFGSEWYSGGRWYEYFRLLLVAVIIGLVWNLIGLVGGGGAHDAIGGWFGNGGRNILNWATGDRRDDEGLLGGRFRRRREATEKERQAQEQLESIQAARQRLTEMEATLQQHIEDPDIRRRFNNIAMLLIELRQVQRALDAAENQIRGRI